MNTSLDIQLEFMDYNIGDHLKKYYGYYVGICEEKIMIMYSYVNMISINHFNDIDEYILLLKETEQLRIEYNLPNRNQILYLLLNVFKYAIYKTNNYFILNDNIIYNYNEDKFEKLIDKNQTELKESILRMVLLRTL